jgi:hypothetical protein
MVTLAELTTVKQLARKYTQNYHAIFYDKNLRQLMPEQGFQAATEDWANTIFMVLDSCLQIT